MGAKMPYGGVGLKVGQVVTATGAVLIPVVGVVKLVPIPVVAAAANSGFKFRATGRVANGGVSTDACWGLLFRLSPNGDVMASSFEFPQTAPIVVVRLNEEAQWKFAPDITSDSV